MAIVVDLRSPQAHTCAVVKSCTRTAATHVTVDHRVVVWACEQHGPAAPEPTRKAA